MNLKKIVYNLNIKKLLRKYILFESNPDFSDNSKAVYDELIKRKINERYKLIWLVKDKNKFNDIKIKNVRFVERNKKISNIIKYAYYRIFSKYIVDCNNYIHKTNKYQYRIYLSHGTCLKLPRFYCENCGEVDNIITTSNYFINSVSELYKVQKEKIKETGFPRNDTLFSKNDYFYNMYKNGKFSNVIVWMPTYRNHKEGTDSASITNIKFKYAVPCINNEKELIELNKVLCEKNSLLIIKTHPVEDLSNISGINLSNIIIFDNDLFNESHTTIYDLLSITDVLITDYSSIYFDFLITKKPIALTIPDIEEYKKHVDLLFDKFECNLAGEIIYDYNQLYNFFIDILSGKDNTLNDRLEKIKLFDKYHDNNSTERVVDILIDKIKED